MNDYLTGHPMRWYATAMISAADGIAAALARNPDAVVTNCGSWSVTRLVQHVGSVHRWATHWVRDGSPPDDKTVLRAPDGADLGQWLIDGATDAAAMLADLDPDAPMANPWPIPQIAGVWPRRMAHETALHRADADDAIGVRSAIDPQLASDGIDEYLLFAVPRLVRDGAEIPAGSLHLHCTDTDGEWLVFTANDEYRVDRVHAKGDAALRAPANTVLRSVWGRPTSGLEIIGDRSVAAAWLNLGGV